MAKKLLYELSQLKKLLLESPTFPSRIAALRIAFPDTPDSTLRGLLKRQDIAELFDRTKTDTVLVIGDTHFPFTLNGYLEHCQSVYKSEGCTRVVHIGDVMGNHRASFHPDELDALNADDELEAGIKIAKRWAEAFPDVDAFMGNHDKNVQRQNTAAGVSHRFLRPYNEAIEVPWRFHNDDVVDPEPLIIDNVRYVHNGGSSPSVLARSGASFGYNLVGGHIHTKAGVATTLDGEYFGVLTGCGIDRRWYDLRYASNVFKPYIISCAVVYEGKAAAIFPMDI